MKRKYAVILGSLGSAKDRFCGNYKDASNPDELLAQVAKIPHISGIELVGTWDVNKTNVEDMRKKLADNGLTCVSIVPDVFTDKTFSMGSLSSSDASIRQKALDGVKEVCDLALKMDCDLVNLWPGQDGYDYLLCTDYDGQRQWMVNGIQEIGNAYPDLRLSLEYKPKEPRTHSLVARMADTVLLVQEAGCKNVGITLDTGHAFVAGENVAEAIVIAKRAGNKLMHMHFNDNHGTWDDDMMVGSVHSICFLEMLYWLDRTGYEGWLSMDQYPYREDSISAIAESIEWLVQFDCILEQNRSTIDRLVKGQNAIDTSRFLRSVLVGSPSGVLG